MDPELPPELALLGLEPAPAPEKSRGARIGMGIGLSLLVWVLIDLVLSWINIWVFVGLLGVGLIFVFRSGGQRFRQLQIILIFAGCVLGWGLIVYLFSFFKVWMLLLLTAGLAAAVYYKEKVGSQRQRWLDTGCCGSCGYDLRASPDRCPECGRETALDEPTWRKLRREWGHIKPADQKPVAALPVEDSTDETMPES
jgi:hypothetical protein